MNEAALAFDVGRSMCHSLTSKFRHGVKESVLAFYLGRSEGSFYAPKIVDTGFEGSAMTID